MIGDAEQMLGHFEHIESGLNHHLSSSFSKQFTRLQVQNTEYPCSPQTLTVVQLSIFHFPLFLFLYYKLHCKVQH